MSGGHLSKEFFELVKSIGESRSKTEEDRIIVHEIGILKGHLSQPGITPKKMKEYMIRAVYAEMLGHDASFAYIHAVKLTAEKNLFAKRIGYLTCNLFLHKEHELMVLLINMMVKDLNSANHLKVCAALTAVCRLVNTDMIPAIAPLVFKLFSHPQEVVRKKAVVAVHRMFKLVPETVFEQKEQIRKVLCDPDPGVMGASLHVLFEMGKAQPANNKDLVPSFVSILKQVTEHRLPRDFDYHRMPAPWLQVKLLSLLGVLGAADQRCSEQMYEILQECMRRADSGVNVGFAIIYECVKCITRIYPDHSLLELAASNISRFISSDNHNIRYLGVNGLAQIVQVNPTYAAEHQMVVVDCLEDPDETLKRKTLDLLFRMTNSQNVIVVVEKLVFFLRTSVDTHLRKELVQRVTSLAERFAPDNEWYVNTMNSVFELGGELVPVETAHNLMRLVAEGTGDDEGANTVFRTFAVNTYLKMLEKANLPDILVQVIAWVLGEYARLVSADGYTLEDIVDLLCECIERPFEDVSTRGYLVSALMKMVGQNGVRNSSVDTIITSFRSSRVTDLQQRCYEFTKLKENPGLMRKVLPYDASCEDLEVNRRLSFLDSFVRAKLDQGAKPYQDVSQRGATRNSVMINGADTQDKEESRSGLNFTPYEAPSRPQARAFPASVESDSATTNNGPALGMGDGKVSDGPSSAGFNASAAARKGPWGPRGYNEPAGGTPATPAVAAQPSPQPTQPAFTPSTTPTPAASKPAAAEPAAMTEKQRLAASLFGGFGPAAGSTATNGRTQPAPPTTAPTPVPVQSTTQAPPPESSPPPTQAVPSGAGTAALDLLDFDTDGSPPSANPAQSPPAAAGQAGDDMLLLDMADPPPQMPVAPTPSPSLQEAPLPQQQLLAPLQIATAQFGGMWGQLGAERKVELQTSLKNCREMMTRLQTSVNVHPVEIIGTEGIAAGRFLANNEACLFHGRLAPPRLDLLVRSRDSTLSQKAVELAARALV